MALMQLKGGLLILASRLAFHLLKREKTTVDPLYTDYTNTPCKVLFPYSLLQLFPVTGRILYNLSSRNLAITWLPLLTCRKVLITLVSCQICGA